MLYQMIANARDRWLRSAGCTVTDLLGYIMRTGQLRDAQMEAVKTYLFLKIECGTKALAELFCEGKFNSLDLNTIPLTPLSHDFLFSHPEAAALLEYSLLKNDKGEQVSEKLAEELKAVPESVDAKGFFQKAFYGVSYTDYLFSLPMGAGKTYLMAAFIYLDLYFAQQEPENPVFAHNFIIFAPSGLKSSVVPSLKTIQNFDPEWVIPQPAASQIRRMLCFEVLDQGKTASKSNKTKNPNVQKIANHQPLSELFGLVAVTNAEKVILDRINEKQGQLSLYEESDDERDRQANELRNLIGKLPALSVFIDEVHHAVSEEIKLRAVVTAWAQNGTVNSVIGFSGTPYLEKAEKIQVTDSLSVGTAEIANVVYYYPLVDGVGNFLKSPVVKIAETADRERIIENGVREFLNAYQNTVYQDGTTAKLGIYCGTIEALEETVFPLVSRVMGEYGLPVGCVLKFHKGNKRYPQPADSQMQFDTLDKPISPIRIILLVQIGKEGWDCRSLTGIILSQEGDCPKNMVLQTSCRCLRQVDKGKHETALIYLNSVNGEKLIAQLQQQHHISLEEFSSGSSNFVKLNRYDRTKYLKLPKVDFYQLKVSFETVIEQEADPEKEIPNAVVKIAGSVVKRTDFSLENIAHEVDDTERGRELAVFSQWIYRLSRSSFGLLTMEQLAAFEDALKEVFDAITYEGEEGRRYFSSRYDRAEVEANIRKSFCGKRSFETKTERIPEEASLLNISHFSSAVYARNIEEYFPGQDTVERIVLDDKGRFKSKPEIEAAIHSLEADGSEANLAIAKQLRAQTVSHPQKDRSFHYLPYHTDSRFEQTFLQEVLPLPEVERFGLEVYYNGDRAMTEFKIKCYSSAGHGWNYIGMYTPDFLVIQRKGGKIHKALIVETKGKIYANDPTFQDKRMFVESEFLRQNNAAFGYERFEYLYLEDSMPEQERIVKTHEKIQKFFEEANHAH